MLNEGYKTTRDDQGINKDLCYEAIRLAGFLSKEFPQDRDICSLLALMFLPVARFPARLSGPCMWITLEEQDRRLWDRRLIAGGIRYLDQVADGGTATPGEAGLRHTGKYYLEALEKEFRPENRFVIEVARGNLCERLGLRTRHCKPTKQR